MVNVEEIGSLYKQVKLLTRLTTAHYVNTEVLIKAYTNLKLFRSTS